MAHHRFYVEIGAPLEKGELVIGGEEARHAARVKRVEVGEPVEVLDGRGGIGRGTVAGIEKVRDQWQVRVEVREVRREGPVRPRVDVRSPAPKGPRIADLIDALSQVGAASWAPLATEHAVREATDTRLERLQRAAAEASKQCGRSWLLEIGEGRALRDVLASGAQSVVMADASGAPYLSTGADAVVLLIGPEGGWSARELESARRAGVPIARFGPHVMRIETAGPVAAAIVIDAERRFREPPTR
jgi:16S rRNA (uracil1498-N3)-methyltransferase